MSPRRSAISFLIWNDADPLLRSVPQPTRFESLTSYLLATSAKSPEESASPATPLAEPDTRLEEFYLWIEGAGALGAAVFFAVFVIASLLLVPKAMLVPAAGYLWGMVAGGIFAFCAVFVASSLGFLITRKLGRGKLVAKFSDSPRFRTVDQEFTKDGVPVIFLLRLAPIMPFGVSNYVFGLTGVRYIPYIIASMLGLIPSVLIYLYSGYAQGEGTSEMPGWVSTSSKGLLFLSIFGGLWFFGRICRRGLRSIQSKPSGES